MWRFNWLAGALGRATLTFFVMSGCGLSAQAGEKTASLIGSAIQGELARAQFARPNHSATEHLRVNLASAVQALDVYLAGSGASGLAWRQYLLWPDLQRAVEPTAPPDLATLDVLLAQFSSSSAGLELPPFATVKGWLKLYRNQVQAERDPAAEANFQKDIETLRALFANNTDLDRAGRAQLGDVVGRLTAASQAPELVRALRERYSQPNLHFEIASNVVIAGMEREVDDVAPVTDQILGTSIRGTGRTVGRVEARLIPSTEQALICTALRATACSSTVGRNGPAVIYTQGQTEILGEKMLAIDSDGIHGFATQAHCQTTTHITGLGSTKHGLVDRIVRRVASKRVGEQKSASELIAARHAETRVDKRMEAESSVSLAEANAAFAENFNGKFRKPMLLRDQYPRLFRISSTSEAVLLTATQSGDSLLGAPGPPPDDFSGSAAMRLRVHESVLNNLANGLFGGKKMAKPQFDELLTSYLGHVPEELDPEEDTDWSITFAARDPISVQIDDDVAAITVRGAAYTKAGKSFDAMNVTARYKLETTAQGFRAVRQGELSIVPPDFDAASGQKMPTRLIILRSILAKRFNKLFAPEIQAKGLLVQGRWSKVGRLVANRVRARDGWLAVAWEQQPGVVSESMVSYPNGMR